MAGVVRSLITRILFKSDPTGLKKVETQTTAVKRQMRAASRAAWQFKRALSGISVGWKSMLAVAVVGRLGKLITHDFAQATDEAAKFADGLGIPIQQYQRMGHAAQLNGVSIKELNTALPNLAKRAGDAADGSKEAALAFKRAGVSVKDLNGKLKDPITLMTDLADGIGQMGDKQRRTQVLMNLFGRSGKKMGVLLSQGSEGIKKAMREADKLGIVLTRDQAKIAENYNDEMLRAKSVLMGLRNQIAIKLLPAITKNIKAFQMWARKGDNLRKMTRALTVALKALAVIMAAMVTIKLVQTYMAMTTALKAAVQWTKLLGWATLKAYAPYLLVAAAIAGIVLVIQSLMVWSRGGKSAVGDLFKKMGIADKARKIVDALGAAWRALVPVLIGIGKAALKVGGFILRVASALWAEFGPDIMALGRALVDVFNQLWPEIQAAAVQIRDALVELGTAAAKTWREDLRPALVDVKNALSDAWTVAKPLLEQWWAIQKKIFGVIWDLAMMVLPVLGAQASKMFSLIAMVIKASIAQLTAFVKGVSWVIGKIKYAIELMKSLLGLQGKPIAAEGGGVSSLARTGFGLKPTTQNNTTSVGTLAVSVNGTTSMGPDEIADATRRGAKKALQELINDEIANMRRVAPVTP